MFRLNDIAAHSGVTLCPQLHVHVRLGLGWLGWLGWLGERTGALASAAGVGSGGLASNPCRRLVVFGDSAGACQGAASGEAFDRQVPTW